MCEPTTAMLALTAASGLVSAKAAMDQGEVSAGIARNNAALSEQAALDAQARGEEEAQAIQRKGAAIKSAQRVGMAANGLDLGYGTTADIQDQTDFFTQSDVATARTNADRETWNRRNEAQNFRTQGEMAKYNGTMSAVGSLLGAGATVAGKWYSPSSAGPTANTNMSDPRYPVRGSRGY